MTDHVQTAQELAARVALKRQPGDEKLFADAVLTQMRADALLSVAVPPAFGGPGLGLGEIARITERIARISGSAGLIYAMHMSQALSVVAHGRGAFFEDFQRRMVSDQILIASGTSEKGPGGDIFTSVCTVTEADGRLSGVKETPNISYLDHAGAVLLTANRIQPKGAVRQVLIVLETANYQIAAPHQAGFMGMRGILNQPCTLTFDAPEAGVFPDLFAPVARRTMTPTIQILWAALWSGIAWGAIAKAKTFLAKEVAKDADVAPVLRHEMTGLINRHFAMNAMIRDTVAVYEASATQTGIGFGAAAGINRLKLVCSDHLTEIVGGALRLIGLRAYAAGGPYSLAEALVDAFSAPVMVSNYRLAMNTAAIEPFVDEAL